MKKKESIMIEVRVKVTDESTKEVDDILEKLERANSLYEKLARIDVNNVDQPKEHENQPEQMKDSANNWLLLEPNGLGKDELTPEQMNRYMYQRLRGIQTPQL